MKQIRNLFFILIMCNALMTAHVYGMQELQRNLHDLTASLQTLSNKLQSPQTQPPPPPAPGQAKLQTGPKFFRAKHYEYQTPSGKILDITFGLLNISPDIHNPAYSLIMYGPQLTEKPTERTFTTMLLSRYPYPDGNSVTFYPEISNENEKIAYTIIDGRTEYAKDLLAQKIQTKLTELKKESDVLQESFKNNYLQNRVQGDPSHNQKGSIYGTSMQEDEAYATQLINFINQVLSNETDFYAIKNLTFYDQTLIPMLTTYFNQIKNFKIRVDEFMKSFGGTTQASYLGTTIHKNKFDVENFGSLNDKNEKASEYQKEIQIPIDKSFLNFENMLEALTQQRENLSKQPMSEIRKYYNNLLHPQQQSPTTPQRDILQALQQTGEKKRPASQNQPTPQETKTEQRKSGIDIYLERERLRREAKAKRKQAQKKAKASEWEDDGEEEN